MRLIFSFLAILLALPGVAQQPASPAETTPASASASVTFSFNWPQGVPWQKYSIEVQSDGLARFDGVPHPDATNDTDPYQQDFVMSDLNRRRIFELSQKLNYFRGDLDSHLKHIAQTGKKTLQYQSPQLQGANTYNYSQNADVQELTSLFLGIATTIDFGRQLAFEYRFDKLGMDKLLKELEDMQSSHSVHELRVIAPILHKIADDPNLMNISRQSAQHILRTMNTPQPAADDPGQM